MTKPTQALKARIEVFRPGTFKPMAGAPITYSAADLKAIADAYDPAIAPAPIVVGHPETDAPAFGWIDRLEYDATSGRLMADLGDIEPTFAEAVKAGRYRKVSMAFYGPDQGHNPVPGTWYPKHVGFLGAAAPAVSGLRNAQFSALPAAATFEFGERGFEETASLLRMLREFFIERFGMEDADRVLPSYRLEWLAETDITPATNPLPNFSEPQPKEPGVTQPAPQPDAAFAAREAEFATREAELAAREAAIVHADHVSFADGLVAEGRLLPVSRDAVVALMDALPAAASVAFAEGQDKVSPRDALKSILEAQPKVVTFGAVDLPNGPSTAQGAAFAADGKQIDTARLETLKKAEAHMAANPGVTFAAAINAVS